MNRVTRKIIEIDEEKCDGCGLCVPACAEGAIQVIDGKAKLVADKYCDGLGACLGDCPNDALQVIERAAVEFDEEAVEEHLKTFQPSGQVEPVAQAEQTMACGCPSSHIQSFESSRPSCPGSQLRDVAPGKSSLTNWPVQIQLVPPEAPFLKNADLLVLADCVGVAYPDVQRDLLPGRVVMMGCPKFDDAEAYIEKFAEIFRKANLRSVTVARMEVPCCSGLFHIVEQAKNKAGVALPVEQVVIGVRGEKQEQANRHMA